MASLPSNGTMKAVVFKGPFQVEVVTKPIPQICEPTDAILKVSSTALCGSDLVRNLEALRHLFTNSRTALLPRSSEINTWVCLRA